MRSSLRHVLSISLRASLTGCLLSCSANTLADDSSDIQFSGFSRIVAGYLDDEKAAYQEYSDSISLSSQSLIGLQLDWQATSNLSFTSQLVAHGNSQHDSGLEWLYLTYQFDEHWQLRLGKQRTPFFSYSDVLDVGFAYSWISPPQQLYNGVLFPNYEGANLQHQFVAGEWLFTTEGYWGSYEGTYSIGNTEISPDVKDLKGIILKARWQNFTARIAYHSARVDIPFPELDMFADSLRQAGFTRSADSLRSDGNVKACHFGLAYHSLDYFVEAEYTKLDATQLVFPHMESAYVTAGIYSPPYTFHVTIASSTASYDSPVDEIPTGIDPQLDYLSSAYRGLFSQLPIDALDSYMTGVRYDLSSNIAVKAEISLLKGNRGERSFFQVKDPSFDSEAILYQVALEWTF